jgi:hypothetical protein
MAAESFGLKTVNDFWGFPNQQDKIIIIIVLTHKAILPDLEEADIHYVQDSHAAELT